MRINRRGAIGGSLALALGASELPFLTRGAAALQATPTAMQATGTLDPYARLKPVGTFTVTSTDVAEGEQLPKAQMSGIFQAGGEDKSPQLAWSGFPDGTKSFFVTMYDPDAPTPSGFWHWAVADIPASVTELAAGAGAAGDASLPQGAYHIPNDARLAQFVGAAPPAGDPPHRYFIAVNALDIEKSEVPKDATPSFLYATLAPHILARAVMVPISAPAG
jgi:Raf kinase inhibitor-like YbhB/YbcL family protein